MLHATREEQYASVRKAVQHSGAANPAASAAFCRHQGWHNRLNLRWCDIDFADSDLAFDDRRTPADSNDGVPPDYGPRFLLVGNVVILAVKPKGHAHCPYPSPIA